ncbi:alpha/beta hydrolase [Candidatus Saccharibacteria bacterium]|nr:alpha/beta hydrolase [Candidatus Saccharibacteria bacterium]
MSTSKTPSSQSPSQSSAPSKTSLSYKPSNAPKSSKSTLSTRPPLLFVHGFRGSSEGLAELTSHFQKEYEVHVPNIPPAGPAKLPFYTADTYAKFIADYIKSHNLDHPIIICHSLGSIIAAATAEKYPDLINDKLILIAPISKKPARIFARLVPLTAFLPTRAVDYITTRYSFVSGGRKLFKKALKITNSCAKSYNSKTEVKKAGEFSASTSVKDYNFHKNTLIIVGEKDRLIPLAATKSYAKKIAANLKIIKNTGHILNYEVPDKVAAAIKDFL